MHKALSTPLQKPQYQSLFTPAHRAEIKNIQSTLIVDIFRSINLVKTIRHIVKMTSEKSHNDYYQAHTPKIC